MKGEMKQSFPYQYCAEEVSKKAKKVDTTHREPLFPFILSIKICICFFC